MRLSITESPAMCSVAMLTRTSLLVELQMVEDAVKSASDVPGGHDWVEKCR